MEYLRARRSPPTHTSRERTRILRENAGNDEFHYKADSGEAIIFSSTQDEDGEHAGFRYEVPDDQGRAWRTELVLRAAEPQNFVAIRVTCLAESIGAEIAAPRKPVIVRQIIQSTYCGIDRTVQVADSPIFLSSDEVEKAARAIRGEASLALPIVYLSSRGDGTLACNPENLAFALGGLAHVLVEPDREFSFLLRDETNGLNPYAGAIGVGLPGQPISMRLFSRGSSRETIEKVVEIVRSTYLGRTAKFGMEWSDLQQRIIRTARQRLAVRHSSRDDPAGLEEWIESFEGEIKELNEKILQLQSENASLQGRLAARTAQSALTQVLEELKLRVGELYDGELLDRLRHAVANSSNLNFSLSARDTEVMSCLLPFLAPSPNIVEISKKLRAASDPEKTDFVFSEVLSSLGFTREASGKHIKFLPPQGLKGISQITIAKTPSDHRAGENSVSELRAALGLRFPD